MPSGTRQDSTQTVYVFERVEPAAIGAGKGWDEVIVAQSTPRAPMMWVAKVTVPERAGEPPVLRNSTVTFSHHRLSAAARSGALSVSAAGAGAGGGAGGSGLPEDPPPGFGGVEGSVGVDGLEGVEGPVLASPGEPGEPDTSGGLAAPAPP